MKRSVLLLMLISNAFLFNGVYLSAAEKIPAAAPNTIDNTIIPCDDSAATRKPDCDVDAESIKKPPKTLDEKNGIITQPKKPLHSDGSAKSEIKKNRNKR